MNKEGLKNKVLNTSKNIGAGSISVFGLGLIALGGAIGLTGFLLAAASAATGYVSTLVIGGLTAIGGAYIVETGCMSRQVARDIVPDLSFRAMTRQTLSNLGSRAEDLSSRFAVAASKKVKDMLRKNPAAPAPSADA